MPNRTVKKFKVYSGACGDELYKGNGFFEICAPVVQCQMSHCWPGSYNFETTLEFKTSLFHSCLSSYYTLKKPKVYADIFLLVSRSTVPKETTWSSISRK